MTAPLRIWRAPVEMLAQVNLPAIGWDIFSVVHRPIVMANAHASLPAAYRLYLPQDWAGDAERRRKAGVPDDVEFMTKPQIALAQIRAAHAAGLPKGVVQMDAGYGVDVKLRMGISELDLAYVGGVLPNTLAWKPGTQPAPGAASPKKGRRDDSDIVSLKEIALALPKKAWCGIEWREGSCDILASRFARSSAAAAKPRSTVPWP